MRFVILTIWILFALNSPAIADKFSAQSADTVAFFSGQIVFATDGISDPDGEKVRRIVKKALAKAKLKKPFQLQVGYSAIPALRIIHTKLKQRITHIEERLKELQSTKNTLQQTAEKVQLDIKLLVTEQERLKKRFHQVTAQIKSGDPFGRYLLIIEDLSPEDTLKLVGVLRSRDDIRYADPNYRLIPDDAPNDPEYVQGNQRAFNGEHGIFAHDAWQRAQSLIQQDALVAVIEGQGVEYFHADLQERVWINPGEIPAGLIESDDDDAPTFETIRHLLNDFDNNGRIDLRDLLTPSSNNPFLDAVDNDQNGFADDLLGWDFRDGDNDPYSTASDHGIRVAGLAVASTDNDFAIASACYNACRLLTLRGNSAFGGVDAVYYAAGLGTDVINMSFGQYNPLPALEEAVDIALESGAISVASSGNESINRRQSPGDFANSIAVSGIDTFGNGHFNFGSWTDVAAPSIGIVSLGRNDSIRSHLDGTSYATPIVAGVAGLIRAVYPDASADLVRNLLLTHNRSIGLENDPASRYHGTGALDLRRLFIDERLPGVIAKLDANHELGDSLVSGTIQFRGEARADVDPTAFQLYYLLAAPSAYPAVDAWTEISSSLVPTTDTDAVVGEFDTLSFPDGPTTVCLFAVDRNEAAVRDCVHFEINNFILTTPGPYNYFDPDSFADGILPQGSVDTNGYRRHEVFVRPSGEDAAWGLLGGGDEPVVDGPLVERPWHPDLGRCENGFFDFRIVAHGDEQRSEEFTHRYIDNCMQAGFPAVFRHEAQAAASSVTVADVRGDSTSEIIVAEDSIGLIGRDIGIHIFAADGEDFHVNFGGKTGVAVGDIDNDGSAELLSSIGSLHSMGHFYTINGDGSLRWDLSGVSSGETPTLVDLTGDGFLEIISPDNTELIILSHDAQILWRHDVGVDILISAAAADIDGDGHAEIAVGTQAGVHYVKFQLNPDSNSITDSETVQVLHADVAVEFPPALMDIDRDGDLEILLYTVWNQEHLLAAYHHDGEPVAGWPVRLVTGPATPIALGLSQLDFSDTSIIVADSLNSYLISHTGKTLTRERLFANHEPVNTTLADVDGDGISDVITYAVSRSGDGDLVYAHSRDGEPLIGFPKILPSGEAGPMAHWTEDLDDDDDLEIVVASDRIYVWDLPSQAAPPSWPAVQGDAHYTGVASLQDLNRFVVNSDQDLVDTVPGDGRCQASNDRCTLRAAVEESNALSGPNAVTVPAGEYVLSQGEIVIQGGLYLNGDGLGTTSIDGAGRDRIFRIQRDSDVFIRRMAIRNGSVDDEGGGVVNFGNLWLIQSRVTGNRITTSLGTRGDVFGAGIYNAHGASLELIESWVDDNAFQLERHPSAAYQGEGGAGIANRGRLEIRRSTVFNNRFARTGGGIYERGSELVLIDSSTISGNFAQDSGAGIDAHRALVQLRNSTVVNNRLSRPGRLGAGLAYPFAGQGIDILNSIVAQNIAGDGVPSNCLNRVTSISNNLLGPDCEANASNTDIRSDQPGLEPLQFDGDQSPAHPLSDDSPVIDAGLCTFSAPVDQVGTFRPQGNDCDIGAVERSVE